MIAPPSPATLIAALPAALAAIRLRTCPPACRPRAALMTVSCSLATPIATLPAAPTALRLTWPPACRPRAALMTVSCSTLNGL